MTSPYIDFISAYCDRWCERCSMTERCSLFACEQAIAMTGDEEAGIELAVGTPRSPDTPSNQERERDWLDDLNVAPTAAELEAFTRQEDARRASIEALPLARLSSSYLDRAHAWIQAHSDELEQNEDRVLREAFQVVRRDARLIYVKVYRALDGALRSEEYEPLSDQDPVQNDWNGSAKIALLCMERSAAAWTCLGPALNDPSGTSLAAALEHLSRAVLERFPDARSFVRPGFDQS